MFFKLHRWRSGFSESRKLGEFFISFTLELFQFSSWRAFGPVPERSKFENSFGLRSSDNKIPSCAVKFCPYCTHLDHEKVQILRS